MVVPKYVNESNLQIAMTEYRNLKSDTEAVTYRGVPIGTVTQVYDNETGAGEQVFAVVSNPDLADEDVQEVTVLFRGSTSPDEVLSKPADVWNDWIENDVSLMLFYEVRKFLA